MRRSLLLMMAALVAGGLAIVGLMVVIVGPPLDPSDYAERIKPGFTLQQVEQEVGSPRQRRYMDYDEMQPYWVNQDGTVDTHKALVRVRGVTLPPNAELTALSYLAKGHLVTVHIERGLVTKVEL